MASGPLQTIKALKLLRVAGEQASQRSQMRLGGRPAGVIRLQIRAVPGDDVAALAGLGVRDPRQDAIEMANHHVGVIDGGDRPPQPHDDDERRDTHE